MLGVQSSMCPKGILPCTCQGRSYIPTGWLNSCAFKVGAQRGNKCKCDKDGSYIWSRGSVPLTRHSARFQGTGTVQVPAIFHYNTFSISYSALFTVSLHCYSSPRCIPALLTGGDKHGVLMLDTKMFKSMPGAKNNFELRLNKVFLDTW